MNAFFAKAVAIWDSEPAALIGACVSAIVAVYQTTNGHVTWAAVYPVLIGVITRFAVSPAGKNVAPPVVPPVPPAK